jgi:hypothetical protein
MARDLTRVFGHGMTRKFTERDCRGGFNTKGAKAFLGIARVVGHGMTRKSTEREDRRDCRAGFNTKTRKARREVRVMMID